MTKMSNICFSLLVSVSKQRYQFATFHPHYQALTLFIVQNRAGLSSVCSIQVSDGIAITERNYLWQRYNKEMKVNAKQGKNVAC